MQSRRQDPLPPPAPIPFIKLPPELLSPSTLHPLSSPHPSFACRDCLRVDTCPRLPRGSWNRIVAHLSNFLLYGHEVPRPTWFTPPPRAKRLGPRTPQIARHREQILQALLEGWSYARIAQHLSVPHSYITYHVHALYQHHNIKGGRKALAKYLGTTLPSKPNSPTKSPTARPV